MAVSRGVFHPKITTLYAQDDCHLLIGSGNLTFGGWGINLEVVEHLHPSFAADAFADMADFFEYLTLSDRMQHGASDHCLTNARDLRSSITGRQRDGNIRVFHSLVGAISDQIAQSVEELGGALKLVAVAPFWDEGAAISKLAVALGLDQVFVHAHSGGTVEGRLGANWPTAAKIKINAVQLHVMEEEKPRRLHAKVLEILCRHGRILLSGSANMTASALGEGFNVEACVARIQRNTMSGWSYSPAQPLEAVIPIEDDQGESADNVDILRAVLSGDTINGLILSKKMSGRADVFQVTSGQPVKLGETIISAEGNFRSVAPDLEMQSWRGGRLVLRVEGDNGVIAEGFVSIAAFAEMTRKAGTLAPRLLAILYGSETPADVAAIMSWIHEDPRRLRGSSTRISSGAANTGSQELSGKVAIAELRTFEPVRSANHGSSADVQYPGWQRFIDHVFSALREPRGPFGQTANNARPDDDDDGDKNDDSIDRSGEQKRPPDQAIAKALVNFEKLLDVLLSPGQVNDCALMAFDLANYICDRLDPTTAQANDWLERILAALMDVEPPIDRIEDVAAAVVTQAAFSEIPNGTRRARKRLLRVGYRPDGAAPQQRLAGFSAVLAPRSETSMVWAQVQTTLTSSELVAAYLAALSSDSAAGGFEDLERLVPEEWPKLKEALRSERGRKEVLVAAKWNGGCPKCRSVLPATEVHKVLQHGIATAKNCCGRVIVYEVV